MTKKDPSQEPAFDLETAFNAVSEIIAAQNNSKALRLISPEAFRVLEVLREFRKRNPSKITIEMLLAAEQSEDHAEFDKTFATDVTTINATLKIDDPKEFFLPIVGGELFLQHILYCQYCFLSVLSDFDKPDKKSEDIANQALDLLGFKRKPRTDADKKLTDHWDIPKPN